MVSVLRCWRVAPVGTIHNSTVKSARQPPSTVINASGIDTARVNQIILRAICSCLSLTFAVAVGNDVALGSWRVLQLNCVVVESSLLIVEADVAILVKLRRTWRCTAN